MMKFRLLAGQHIQKEDVKDDSGKVVINEETGKPERASRVYNQGDVVPSETDLVKKLGASKFQLIDSGKKSRKEQALAEQGAKNRARSEQGTEDDSRAEEVTDTFDDMTVAELKDYAAENEIDLEGAHLKADIVKKIRESEAE